HRLQAEDAREDIVPGIGSCRFEVSALAREDLKSDIVVDDGQLGDYIDDMDQLRFRSLEMLSSRRDVVEEIPDHDRCTCGTAHILCLRHISLLQAKIAAGKRLTGLGAHLDRL